MTDDNQGFINNILNDNESQPDELHGIVESHISKPISEWGEGDHSNLNRVISHPNSNTGHITKLYNHVKGGDDNLSLGSLTAIFNNDKVSPSDAEDYIQSTHKNLDQDDLPSFSPSYDSHLLASKVPGVSREILQDINMKQIDNPDLSILPYQHDASFLHSLYSQREDSFPAHHTDINDINHNKKMSKIDSLFFDTIGSADHSKEELQNTVNILNSPNKPTQTSQFAVKNTKKALASRPDIQPEQLDSIYESSKGDVEVRQGVINSKNISPDLIAKIALSSTEQRGEVRIAALSSPKLPTAIVDRFIDNYNPEDPGRVGGEYSKQIMDVILGNKELDAGRVSSIYNAGNDFIKLKALSHPNADPAIIEDYWVQNKHKRSTAEELIDSVPNLPPSVLTDIVSDSDNLRAVKGALDHQNVNIDVVQSALKRSDPEVQKMASMNPLVSVDVLDSQLKTGSLAPADFLFDKATRKAAGEITEDQVGEINKQYKSKDISDYDTDDYKVKDWLATSKEAGPEINKQNKEELLDHYSGVSDKPNSLSELVAKIASYGDVDFQNAALLDQATAERINLSNTKLSSDFLEGMSSKVYGFQLKRLIENPKTPQYIFDAWVKENNEHGDYDFVSDDPDSYQNVTVFDGRYGNLPEEDRVAAFQGVLSLGGDVRTEAVVISKFAPLSVTDQAFSLASNELKRDIIAGLLSSNEDLKNKISDRNFINGIVGRFNFDGDSHNQRRMMSRIDTNNPAHVSALSGFIDQTYSQDWLPEGTLPSSDILGALKRSERRSVNGYGEGYDHIVASSMRVEESLALGLIDSKIVHLKLNNSFSSEKMANSLNDIINSSSSGDIRSINRKWVGVAQLGTLSDGKDETHFDFLADMPGDKETGFTVKTEALVGNLLSKSKAEEVSMQHPDFVDSAMSSNNIPSSTKISILDNIFNSGEIDPNFIDAGIKNIALYVKSSEKGQGKIDKALDIAIKSGLEDSVVNIKTNSYNFIERKNLNVSILGAIMKHPSIEESKRNKLAVDFIVNSDFNLGENEMSRSIVEGIKEKGDIESASRLILGSHLNLYSEMSKDLVGVVISPLSNSSDINTDSLLSMYSIVMRNPQSAKTKDKITLIERLEEKHKINMEDKAISSAMLNMSYSVLSLRDASEKETKKAIDTLKGSFLYGIGDADSLQSKVEMAAKTLRLNSVPLDDRADLFVNIPSDISTDSVDLRGLRLDNLVLDHPEVLLNSTHGWKLNLYVNNANVISNDTASSITERVLHNFQGSEGEQVRSVLLSRMYENSMISRDNKRKVFNTLSGAAKVSAVVGSLGDGRFISGGGFDGLGGALQHLTSMANETYDSVDSDMEYGNYNAILSHMSRINKVMRNEDIVTENTHENTEEAQVAINNYISGSIKLSKKINSTVLSKLANSPEDVSAGEFASYMEGNRRYSETLFRYRGLGSNSMGALSVAMSTRNAVNEYKKTGNSPELSFDVEDFTSDLINKWAKKADSDNVNWKEALNMSPEVVYSFNLMPIITKEAISAINMTDLASASYVDQRMLTDTLAQWPSKVPIKDHDSLVSFSKDIFKYIDHDNRSSASDFYSKLFDVAGKSITYDDVMGFSSGFTNKAYGRENHNTIMNSAARNNIGGERLLKSVIDNDKKNLFVNFSDYGYMAKFNSEMLGEIVPSLLKSGSEKDIRRLASNPNLDSHTLKALNHHTLKMSTYDRSSILKKLVKHANIDYDTFSGIYDETKDDYGSHEFKAGSEFNPAFLNVKFGNKLFRAQPVAIPESLPDEVDKSDSKIIKTVEYSKEKDTIRSLAGMIPPEGVSYAGFKKINKKMAENPTIKSLFLSSKAHLITPEDVSRAVESGGSGGFHVTYASWSSSLQRHMRDNSSNKYHNLVMQLNTGESLSSKLSEDPKLWAFFKMVQDSANRVTGNEIGAHPVTPHIVSWSRIETSGGEEGWVLEEAQSDFTSSLRGQIKKIKQDHPDGLSLEGEFYHPDEMMDHAKKIEGLFKDWHGATVKGAVDLAKKQGVKNLFMHGVGIRSALSFGGGEQMQGRKEQSWMKEMYEKFPKKNGWEQVDYSDYPNYNKTLHEDVRENHKHGTVCWKLKLT